MDKLCCYNRFSCVYQRVTLSRAIHKCEQCTFIYAEPGILYEVLVMAVNDEGNGPSVRKEFYGSQPSRSNLMYDT